MNRWTVALAVVLLGTGIPGCSQEEGTSELIQPREWWRVHPRPVYATLAKVATYQEWFDVYRLAEGTYALYEPNQFEEAISYLVLGSERGVLIDAGTGIGDIRQAVEELTDLPVSVVLTHEHYDHIGGAYRFDEIAAPSNPAGLEVLSQGRDNASLQGYLTDEYLWKPLPQGFDGATWTIPPITPTQLLDEGDTIDLGGRMLEVIETPGHSPAHICLLDRENRLLWTGPLFPRAALRVRAGREHQRLRGVEQEDRGSNRGVRLRALGTQRPLGQERSNTARRRGVRGDRVGRRGLLG